MDSVITLRLRIDGNDFNVPTFKNTSLQLSRRIQSMDNIGSDQGTITEQTFNVPLNNELVNALGDLADPSQESDIDLRKQISGFVVIDGVPFYEGSFQVVSIMYTPDNYAREVELIFKGNETDVKAKLDLIKLSEVFDGELLEYSASEINDYYSDHTGYPVTTGYTWDLIDWGQGLGINGETGTTVAIDDDTAPLSQLNFKPSVTLQKCFDQIADYFGFSISIPSTDFNFQDWVIPLHNNKSNLPALDVSPKDFTGYMDRTNNLNYDYSNNTIGSAVLVNFNRAVDFNQTVFNVSTDRYTAARTGTHSFEFTGDFTVQRTAASGTDVIRYNMRFYLYKNGVQDRKLGSATGLITTETDTVNVSFQFDILLEDSDYVDIRWSPIQTIIGAGTYTLRYQQQGATTIFECISSPTYSSNIGDPDSCNVLIKDNIPEDLTCWDVVSTVISLCNGILIKDGDDYDITPWIDWIDDNTDIVNLNDKLAKDSAIKIEPTGVTGAKSIRFGYEESDLFYNQKFRELQEGREYGELFIPDTGSDFATGEYELKIPFINPVPVPMAGSTVKIHRIIDEDGELTDTKPMLLPKGDNYLYLQDMYLQDDFGGSTYTIRLIPSTLHWIDNPNGGFTGRDSNFGTSLTFFASQNYPNNTLYEVYWRRYIRETYGEKSRKYNMQVSLTPTEFQTLIMNEKLLYRGAYFRFNAIENFNLNKREPVNIEIVKRVDLLNSDIAPYYPTNVLFGVVQWSDSSDGSSVGDGSLEPAADIESSCLAYGFRYDSVNNIGIQFGQILPIN